MDSYIIAIFILIATLITALGISVSWIKKLVKNLGECKEQILAAEKISGIFEEKTIRLHKLEEENKLLADERNHAINERVEADTILKQKIDLLSQYTVEKKAAETARDEAIAEKNNAETRKQLALQSVAEMQVRIDDWEKTKNEISLITSNKAGEMFHEETEKVNKKYQDGFQNVTNLVTNLKEQWNAGKNDISIIRRALSTSSAIGQFAENALLNTLKQYGLVEGKDFFYQSSYHADEGIKRPDYVLRLPNNNLIVIDSKASQFFFELAENQGNEREAELTGKLKKRMNEHLNSLASKEYHASVRKTLEKSGEKINGIFTILFLHSDAQVEKICQIDQEYNFKCVNNGIILAGPTGISGPIFAANILIERERQDKNREEIILELQNMLGNLSVSVRHAEKVNKSIKNAYDHFRNFASSFNRNVLSKAKKLESHGVSLPKGKELPESIRLYTEETVIEGEAEEVMTRLTGTD